MKLNKILFIGLVVTLIATASFSALAADTGSLQDEINTSIKDLGAGAGYQASAESGNLPQLVGKIINVFLYILGVLFVVLMVYGGYSWMTSYGNTQKLDKAKNLIADAIIGLIIIMLAYGIARFVVGQLSKATTT